MNKKKASLKNWLLNLVVAALFLVGVFLIAKPYIYDFLNGQKADKTLTLVDKALSEKDAADLVDKKRRELQRNKDLYSGLDVENISKEAYQNSDAKDIIFRYGIGKIYFKEQNIAVPVVEGVTNEALLAGAGTLKPDQQVGKGNFALAGHRLGTNQSVLFSHIMELNQGDHVELTIGNQKAVYIIQDKKIIEPTEVQYIEDSQGEGLLTLICCTDDGTQRWMVRGTLQKQS